nr:MAG TPA: deoxynucleoside monophosphate kinase [Caudoviricetes sp.]
MTAPVIMMPDVNAVPALIDRRDVPTSLVGFVGLKRSGKDTAAQGLITRGWKRMAFADPLKEMSMKLRGVWVEVPEELGEVGGAHLDSAITVVGGFAKYHEVVDALGMEKAKDLVPDVRTVLQTLGTDCVRGTLGERTWTDLTGQRVQEELARGEAVALTDVRFDEEFNLVHDLGGLVIGVWRGDHNSLDRALVDASVGAIRADHVSETNAYSLLQRADVVICNCGSVSDLHRAVWDIVG